MATLLILMTTDRMVEWNNGNAGSMGMDRNAGLFACMHTTGVKNATCLLAQPCWFL